MRINRNEGLEIIWTKHAVQRCLERGIDGVRVLNAIKIARVPHGRGIVEIIDGRIKIVYCSRRYKIITVIDQSDTFRKRGGLQRNQKRRKPLKRTTNLRGKSRRV